jgi:hypothetical protein
LELNTGAAQELAPVDGDLGATGIASMDWDPTRMYGLVSIGSGICQGILKADRSGTAPIRAVVSDGTMRFNLADEFNRSDTDCSATGRADLPAISRSDGQVAFFASPAAVGVSGLSRLDSPSGIYLTGHDFMTPQLVLSDVIHPGSLMWSPDGKWLAFSGEVGDFGSGGWLFSPSSRALRRFTSAAIGELAWAPDGERIAALESPSEDAAALTDRHVLVFDVGKALR